MAHHELRVRPSVAKDLRGIAKADLQCILARIEALREERRAPGCQKLGGAELHRARQGVHRIVHAVHDGWIVVEMTHVGHRSDGVPPRLERR